MNIEMLALANKAVSIVSERIGYSNVSFLEGEIECLDSPQKDFSPLIANQSIEVVLSNYVLNLANPSSRERLLSNKKRVLKPQVRIGISDIVSNLPVPIRLQKDPELWSGCISK